MVSTVELVAVEFSHLRGYTNASLAFGPRTLLVGPNNSGKSSLFAVLDWVFAGDLDALTGERRLSPTEQALLLPSRDSRGKARRLTLLVRVLDKRRHARFKCSDGIARLRLTFAGDLCRLTVSPPTRAVIPTEPDACVLLNELRNAYEFVWIPAALGASGTAVQARFQDRFVATLETHFKAIAQGGTTQEYRRMRKIRDASGKAATDFSRNLLTDIDLGVGESLARIDVSDSIEMDSIAALLSGGVRLRLTTGDHDAAGVDPGSVGSGLQSLILLALHRKREFPNRRLILAVEEPEAHLHPSLQHSIARELLSPTGQDIVLITTHSPMIVAEALYGQTVIVKRRQFYPPGEATDATRDAINSSLMQGRAAEAFFADNVLLVEGPGDYYFFEAIRKRVIESPRV